MKCAQKLAGRICGLLTRTVCDTCKGMPVCTTHRWSMHFGHAWRQV